jgi:hypothetical protein
MRINTRGSSFRAQGNDLSFSLKNYGWCKYFLNQSTLCQPFHHVASCVHISFYE